MIALLSRRNALVYRGRDFRWGISKFCLLCECFHMKMQHQFRGGGYMNKLKLQNSLYDFLVEDIGDLDVTTDSIFPADVMGEVHMIAKASGVFCGAVIIKTGFAILDANVHVRLFVKDGDAIVTGQQLAVISGSVNSLLKAERVVLNLVQRMSGVASLTKEAVRTLDSTHTRITDTRKTTPGLRMLEKYAVQVGGGFNHRYGLYDGVMIKDNHIAFAGSIMKAVETVRENIGHMVKVEVETETKEQVLEAVEAAADIIMFDNQSPEEMKKLLELVPEFITTEASGGIQMENLASYQNTGVDYISLGFLTHSYQALDMSMKVII